MDNDLFAEHSWFFRNALVRANYSNLQDGIAETPEYLERFFRNLLLGEQSPLRNRELHLDWKAESVFGDIDNTGEPFSKADCC